MRAYPFTIRIANRIDYSLAEKDSDRLDRVAGQFALEEGQLVPVQAVTIPPEVHQKHRQDLKFRAFGPSIQIEHGRADVVASVRGVRGATGNFGLRWRWDLAERAYLLGAGSSLTPVERREVLRHRVPLVLVDVELWVSIAGVTAPVRGAAGGDLIDTDAWRQPPLSRVNLTTWAEHYTPARESSFLEELFGAAQMTLGQDGVPLPLAQVDLAGAVVQPVVTMHIGARTMSAHSIEAELEVTGAIVTR